jgi:hypothetical protein
MYSPFVKTFAPLGYEEMRMPLEHEGRRIKKTSKHATGCLRLVGMLIVPGLPTIVPISQVFLHVVLYQKPFPLVDPAGQKPNTINPDLVK